MEKTEQGFDSTSITTTGDTHQAALAAAAAASVNARFIMAIQRPRSWDDVRVRLLKECARPGFAEVARYNKPIGKGVKGPSIRFAEACFRYAQNMDAPVTTTFEDKFKRILHVQVVDYEANASYSADITIDKTVERSEGKDRVVLAQRKNSRGSTVYVVEATEDELLNKQNALVSKALRTLILRMMPGDIVEEGQQACMATLKREDAKDPAQAKKRMVDGFAELGIMPRDLEALLGHSLDALQPAELTELREAYATVRDGEATWRSILEAKRPAAEGTKPVATGLEAKLREQAPPATNGTAARGPAAAPAAAPPAPSAPAPLEQADPHLTPTAPCTVCGKALAGECVGSMVQGTYVGRHMACQPATALAPKAAPGAPPAPQQAPAAPPAATAGPPPAPASAPAKAPPKPAAAPAQAPAEPKRTRGPNKPKPGATVPASMPAAAPAAPPTAAAPAAKPMPPCVYCGAPVADEAVWVKDPEGWRHPACGAPAPGPREPAPAPAPATPPAAAPPPAPAAPHPVVDPNDPTGQPCAVCQKPVRDDAIRTHTPAGPKWRHPDCPIFASDDDDLGGDRM